MVFRAWGGLSGILCNIQLFPDSSMVEHSAVNRVVAGSSPARGAKVDFECAGHLKFTFFICKAEAPWSSG